MVVVVLNQIRRRSYRRRAVLLALISFFAITLGLVFHRRSERRHNNVDLGTGKDVLPPRTDELAQDLKSTDEQKAADDEDDWDDFYDNNATAIPYRGDYRELFSLTSRSRKFYPVQ